MGELKNTFDVNVQNIFFFTFFLLPLVNNTVRRTAN